MTIALKLPAGRKRGQRASRGFQRLTLGRRRFCSDSIWQVRARELAPIRRFESGGRPIGLGRRILFFFLSSRPTAKSKLVGRRRPRDTPSHWLLEGGCVAQLPGEISDSRVSQALVVVFANRVLRGPKVADCGRFGAAKVLLPPEQACAMSRALPLWYAPGRVERRLVVVAGRA